MSYQGNVTAGIITASYKTPIGKPEMVVQSLKQKYLYFETPKEAFTGCFRGAICISPLTTVAAEK